MLCRPAWSKSGVAAMIAIAALGQRAAAQSTEAEPNDSYTTASLITLGQDVHGTINQSGDVDYFAVDLEAGTRLEFYLTYPSDWTPTQWFIDRDGTTIIEQRDWHNSSGVKLLRQVIPTSGRYFLRVASFDGGSGRSYSIRLKRYVPPPTGPGDPAAAFYVPTNRNMVKFSDVAAGASGDLFASWSNGAIRVRANGTAETATDVHSNNGAAEALTVDGYGNLLIGACKTEAEIPCHETVVWKISPAGERSSFFSVSGPLNAITVAPDGEVWASVGWNQGNPPSLWYRVDPDGVLRDTISLEAFHIRFSPSGELYYTHMYDGLYKVVGGHPQRVVTPTREEAFLDFVFDQDGRIYIVVLRDPGQEDLGADERIVLYDAQYRLARDPLAVVDDHFAQFSVDALAFLRDANGAMTDRLVAVHNGYYLGVPSFPHTEIVELNHAATSTAGLRVGVDLSTVTLASSQNGFVGTNYSNTLRMADAPPGIRWTVETGSLPPGVKLSETTGELSGVPTDTGSFTFAVRPKSDKRVGFGRLTIHVSREQQMTIAVTDIANALMGGTSLTAEQVQYLDAHGNHNGVLDVGDLRAYLRAQGHLASSARP